MTRTRPFRSLNTAVATIGVIAALTLGACSSGSGQSASTEFAATTESGASGEALPTVTEGKLTIATGEPAYSPWVENDDPASGEGYEAAVAYAVADKLGFAKADVVWTRTTFDAAIAPGAKDWDMNLQQFSITDERKKAVDFSSPYYTTAQAVVTVEGSAAAGATSIADLADVQFGVQVGTTSQTMITDTVKPKKEALVFNSSQDTVQALKGGQVDAIVVDLPTALYLVSAELDKGVVVGQFADTSGGDQYGIVLPKGSELTTPVSEAVDELQADGTLATLQKKWL